MDDGSFYVPEYFTGIWLKVLWIYEYVCEYCFLYYYKVYIYVKLGYIQKIFVIWVSIYDACFSVLSTTVGDGWGFVEVEIDGDFDQFIIWTTNFLKEANQ